MTFSKRFVEFKEFILIAMKKYMIFLFTLFLQFNNCFGQSGWCWQNPLPQGNDLFSANYVNSNLIITVGDNGTFMKSTDGGLNWTISYFLGGLSGDLAKSLSASCFLNSFTGFISTGNGTYGYGLTDNKLLRTTNSGMTWITVASGSYPSFRTIFFTNEFTGWACCSYEASSNNQVLKTTNSGLNWFVQNSSIQPIYSMYFLNENTGWLTGYYSLPYPATICANYVYKTSNGGQDFFLQLDNSSAQTLKSVFFENENTGWAGGTKLWKTTNSGSTWSFQDLSVNTISFLNEQTGFCANNNGILKSTNGGNNWLLQTSAAVNSISILDSENIFVAGYKGTLLRTTNGGNNWNWLSQSITSNPITSLDFVNENTGFCIYHYWSYPPYPATILKTVDKGLHWNYNFENSSRDLNDILFVNESTGWIAGDNGLIYKTSNGGTDWNLQNSNSTIELHKIYFLDENTGWILGVASVLRTTNGGLNWDITNITDPYLNTMNSALVFLNYNTGYIAGIGGIGRSTDRGLSWQRVFASSMEDITKDSANNLYSISLEEFYKSTDLGSTWQMLSNPWLGSVALKMFNSSIGYMVCGKGNLLKTTDGGVTWDKRKLYTNELLRSIFLLDTSKFWIAGDGGIILSTMGSGIITQSVHLDVNVPQSFRLHQNYPNPFNPMTKIKFDVPKASFTKIVIYDLLGRVVTTLVNEELKPGTYSVDWDGSNYASGIYFYRLESADCVQTKKMVLMK